MEQFLPENEYKEVEGRVYLNPQLSVDEGNAFIDNLRAAQAQQNQQIATDTRMLGTDIQSDLGGLVGADSYFTSRYQTPQTNSAVANLRAIAQANALNQALSNEQEMWKKRYNDAYRNYQKRQNVKANAPVSNPYANVPGDDPDYKTTTPKGTASTSVGGVSGAYTVVDPAGNLHVVDMNTNDEETIHPGQKSKTRLPASNAVGGGEIRVLPNGNRVLIKPGYGLTKEGGKYYLVNTSTGSKTQVGG